MTLRTQQIYIVIYCIIGLYYPADAQYKTYTLSVHGDTLNAVDKNGLKQGKWVVHVDPIAGRTWL